MIVSDESGLLLEGLFYPCLVPHAERQSGEKCELNTSQPRTTPHRDRRLKPLTKTKAKLYEHCLSKLGYVCNGLRYGLRVARWAES